MSAAPSDRGTGVAFLPSRYTSTFGCPLHAAVTGHAMVGPPRRKRAPMDHRLLAKHLPQDQFHSEPTVTAPLLLRAAAVTILGILFVNPAAAASTTAVYSAHPIYLFGVPVDFILFGLTLLG